MKLAAGLLLLSASAAADPFPSSLAACVEAGLRTRPALRAARPAVEAAAARLVVEGTRRPGGVHLLESEQYLAQGLATREEVLRASSELARADLRLAEAPSGEPPDRLRLALLLALATDAAGGR